jgi:hypothetical protein
VVWHDFFPGRHGGLGVFTPVALKKGTWLTEYGGEVLVPFRTARPTCNPLPQNPQLRPGTPPYRDAGKRRSSILKRRADGGTTEKTLISAPAVRSLDQQDGPLLECAVAFGSTSFLVHHF